MDLNKEHQILRIYIASTDLINSELANEFIVNKARELNMAGVTVSRGIMGYGASSRIHTSKFWELTDKLPLTVELVDSKEKIDTFYQAIQIDLQNMEKGCMVTKQEVQVLLYKKGK